MNKFLSALFALLIIVGSVTAQVSPKEGSMLNYRLIGFSPFNGVQRGNYAIQIASGDIASDTAFKNNIIKTVVCKTGRAIAEVPSFGSRYTWRVVTFKGHAIKSFSKLYHFQTAPISDLDTSLVRVRVMKHAEKYKDAYVLLDGNRAMYDMEGQLVWYLPKNKGYDSNVRDLKVAPEGTFTLLSNNNALEINYDGELLWKGPDDGKVSGGPHEQYHHEFTRLSNGHYMVLGSENVLVKTAPSTNENFITFSGLDEEMMKKDSTVNQVPFGTVIEYDVQGNVVWSWKASDYFKKSELAKYAPENGVNALGPILHMHENAFFFDEKEKVVYVSFKNISRIVKVKYPEGIVLNEYGEQYKPGVPVEGNGLYCNQHACKRSAVGCLFLFNNNGCNPGGLPKIKKLAEPANKEEPLKKIWEYTCTVERGVPVQFHTGGNVSELPDQSLFVCMGSDYSKLFIVDSDKDILWSALPEKWNKEKETWQPLPQYRASILHDPAQIEQLIFNTGEPLANKQASAR